ncbi:MAG: hypothetical protein COA50_11335 [Flavobacteriaceae bacterium]|nr:MAG: hypothetical protein COA50_11335 [Flavobacteriaceae bacterium]
MQIVFVVFLNMAVGHAQEKYLDKNGDITFEASEKLFEEVKATNQQVTAIINIKTGEIAALALMKGFRFKNSLMEEHFNENYMESESYPKAVFKGTIIDFDFSSLTEVAQTFTTKGTLALHGKEKEVTTILLIQKESNSISITGDFKVTPEDFAIEIPKIVKNKIAKEVVVHIAFNMTVK